MGGGGDLSRLHRESKNKNRYVDGGRSGVGDYRTNVLLFIVGSSRIRGLKDVEWIAYSVRRESHYSSFIDAIRYGAVYVREFMWTRIPRAIRKAFVNEINKLFLISKWWLAYNKTSAVLSFIWYFQEERLRERASNSLIRPRRRGVVRCGAVHWWKSVTRHARRPGRIYYCWLLVQMKNVN